MPGNDTPDLARLNVRSGDFGGQCPTRCLHFGRGSDGGNNRRGNNRLQPHGATSRAGTIGCSREQPGTIGCNLTGATSREGLPRAPTRWPRKRQRAAQERPAGPRQNRRLPAYRPLSSEFGEELVGRQEPECAPLA